MPRIQTVSASTTPEGSKPVLGTIEKAFGKVPNLIATMAHSPAVINSYFEFSQNLSKAALPAKLREQIALVTAGENRCSYCAAAHTAFGEKAGIDADELTRNLAGESADPKTQAALTFASAVVESRGNVDDDAVDAVRDAGFSDAEVLEIITVVSFNILTNYLNNVVHTDNDFPAVALPERASATA